jgi:hypothetical protein
MSPVYQTPERDVTRAVMNRLLTAAGLGALDNPGRLVPELASYVRDHDHFRQLLAGCDPPARREMYEAMSTHLRFTARPLDVYMAEAGASAEARQLPLRDAAGGLHPFKTPVVETGDALATGDVEIAQAAVNEAFATCHLVLACFRCTRAASFAGRAKAHAVGAARDAGWIYIAPYERGGEGRELCPECADVLWPGDARLRN